MADYLPVNTNASAFTMYASGAITGGLLVKASTGAGYCFLTQASTDRAIGVAAHDAPDGGRLTIYSLPGFVHEVPLTNAVVLATTGWIAVPSATAGRIDLQASVGVCLPGTPVGVFVNTTTGTSAGTSGKGRFVGL